MSRFKSKLIIEGAQIEMGDIPVLTFEGVGGGEKLPGRPVLPAEEGEWSLGVLKALAKESAKLGETLLLHDSRRKERDQITLYLKTNKCA